MSKENITVQDIVITYLKNNGYAGVFNNTHCFCGIHDLRDGDPCIYVSSYNYCKAGYKWKCNLCMKEDCPFDEFEDGYCIQENPQPNS